MAPLQVIAWCTAGSPFRQASVGLLPILIGWVAVQSLSLPLRRKQRGSATAILPLTGRARLQACVICYWFHPRRDIRPKMSSRVTAWRMECAFQKRVAVVSASSTSPMPRSSNKAKREESLRDAMRTGVHCAIYPRRGDGPRRPSFLTTPCRSKAVGFDKEVSGHNASVRIAASMEPICVNRLARSMALFTILNGGDGVRLSKLHRSREPAFLKVSSRRGSKGAESVALTHVTLLVRCDCRLSTRKSHQTSTSVNAVANIGALHNAAR